MGMIPKIYRPPTKVEDLFVFRADSPNDKPFLVAVLSDGPKLFLSDGLAPNFPSVWPLWYEPYTIVHPEAALWLEQRRTKTLTLRPDLEDIYTHQLTRGLGVYYPIKGLALGAHPYLEHKIPGSRAYPNDILDTDMFDFGSSIVEFVPVSSREEAVSL